MKDNSEKVQISITIEDSGILENIKVQKAIQKLIDLAGNEKIIALSKKTGLKTLINMI